MTVAGNVGHDVREVRFGGVAIPDNVHEAVTELDTVVFAGDGIAGHMSATNRYNGDAVTNIYDQVVAMHVERRFSIRWCSPARQTSLVLAQFLAMRPSLDIHVAGLVGLSHVYERWIHLLQ